MMRFLLLVFIFGLNDFVGGDDCSDLQEEVVNNLEVDDIPAEPVNEEDEENKDTSEVLPQSLNAWVFSQLPESLDLRDLGIIHAPIGQGVCASGGWISGSQTLEARIAKVSENYIPYSIQNFMNCKNRVCEGAQPYTVNTYTMKAMNIVPESEIPYTKRECIMQGDCSKKCGENNSMEFTNALDDQFVVVAGTESVSSEQSLMEALQDGPVTTCFQPNSVEVGERCSKGCSHANSIIGYSKDKFLLQESMGTTWGSFQDGTWVTTKGSKCADAIVAQGRFPRVFYDYDRANAYYTEVEEGVSEGSIEFVDAKLYGITDENTKNWGTVKNKCAFIGSACKGVVQLSSGNFELVSDFGVGESGSQSAFKKTQMLIFLKDEKTGKYIGIRKKNNRFMLKLTNKNAAAPFYTSYSRLISFDYPNYHLMKNRLEKIKGGINDIDTRYAWTLNNCRLSSAEGDKFLDLNMETANDDGLAEEKWTLSVSDSNQTSPTQRFDLGISGAWNLVSRHLDAPLGFIKGSGNGYVIKPTTDNAVATLRWNARQIFTRNGKALGLDGELSSTLFDFNDKINWYTPTDCTLSRKIPGGGNDHLDYKDGKFKMSTLMDTKWTFDYADL